MTIPSYYLNRLILNNFKSYRGEHVIGPFLPFTCIIGPNGSGKSNIMDAASFVLGVRASTLRANKLADFIHRASESDSTKSLNLPMNVTAVFRSISNNDNPLKQVSELNSNRHTNDDESENEDEIQEIQFKRAITGKNANTSIYSVDGKTTSLDMFHQKLNKIGLDGDIDGIVQRTPRELGEYFEDISGSIQYKVEYDTLKELCESSDSETGLAMLKRRGVVQEQKMYSEQKKEAERFQDLVNERKSLQNKTNSWQENKNTEAEKNKQLVSAEQQLAKKQREVENQKPKLAKEAATVRRTDQARKNAENRAKRVQTDIDNEKEKLKELTRQLNEAQREKRIQEGKDIDTAQEYVQRREEVENKIAEFRSQLEELEGPQSIDLRKRADLSMRRNEGKEKLEKAQRNLDELNQRLHKDVEEREQENQNKLINLETEINEEEQELKEKETRLIQIDTELDQQSAKLRDARADMRETERDKIFKSTLTTLKRLFGTERVKGCLADLCIVKERKYFLAVTVSMGACMDAIVVDTAETAKECITYIQA
ncbi:MAG: putative Structural maintenance of chromosomes protein 1 [Streblomastix strix]|uniref:Putative Structural maintenance of chromosomes protein 1 n=1 Tax=Streblomastix strix TaxID=222440 RepID=A0A5J4W3P8_9EUKA|nr:MAG: putative Structural maintenance of chromosomes protein 1 [Streblomastix strix]